MANQKISALNSATTTDGTEVLPVVQSAETKKMAVSVIKDYLLSVDGTFTNKTITGGTVNSDSVTSPDMTLSGVNAAALHRSPNAVTAMFVYDTSKDSDGGAWTEKCQHTSWYNEDINGKWLGAQASEAAARAVAGATAGDYFQLTTNGKFYKLNAASGTTEVFRGNKRDFPRLAGIVAEAGNVNIYDLTEPGRPMWMRFASLGVGESVLSAGTPAVSAVSVTNALLGITQSSGYVLTLVNFAAETVTRRGQSAGFNGKFRAPLSARNISSSTNWSLADPSIVGTLAGTTGNAVAMTVLPDAPVDPVTGLKVPTIAVATAGGVSVIQHSGVVRNSSSPLSFATLTLTPTLLSAGRADTTWYWAQNPGALGASFALSTDTNTAAPDFNTGNTTGLLGLTRSEVLRRSSAAATVQKLKNFESDPAKSAAATITNTFNTGHQPGDIRRTYLSDNVVESVGPSTELVTNGTFDTDISGWSTASSFAFGTVTWDGVGALLLTKDATSPSYIGASAAITTVVGKTYLLTFTKGGSSPTSGGVHLGTAAGGSQYLSLASLGSGAGTYRYQFAATATSAHLTPLLGTAASISGTFDNISVKEVVADRSYKAQGASITGALTKSAVASAAELVAYSGFSASNYLREPYSADLDFGTGEWSVGAWVNVPVSLPVESFPVVGPELVTNGDFSNGTTGWTATADTGLSVIGGQLEIDTNTNAVSGAYQSFSTVAGKFYKATATLKNGTATNANVRAVNGFTNTGTFLADSSVVTSSANTEVSVIFAAISAASTVYLRVNGLDKTAYFDNISVKEVAPALIADRAHSSGARLSLGVTAAGRLEATAYDGTTTRTVTTTAAYNTATWAKAEACYTTDGTLAIRVNGNEVAVTRDNPLLTLNNSNAVLTIGNSYNLDAPFPGSIALLKLSATVPTAEQSVWMYEQEKQMFREGAKVCLPDSGAIVDLTYDDATDKWIAVSATNESEWSGLVRTSVTPVPAGSYTKAAAASGVQLLARSTTNPGVDITIPAYGLREELVKRAEAAARLNAQLATFDYVGGFTASTTNGNTAIVSVDGLTYPTSYIGARVTGSGIPADTVVAGVSGTTIYLTKAATATATGVAISFSDFILPVGYEAKEVSLAGAAQREGSTQQFTRLFDGFKETIRFGTAPSNTAHVQIQAARSAA